MLAGSCAFVCVQVCLADRPAQQGRSVQATEHIGMSNAGLDEVTGLCCPVGLRELLADSFEKADKLLLDELRGKLSTFSKSAGANPEIYPCQRERNDLASDL